MCLGSKNSFSLLFVGQAGFSNGSNERGELSGGREGYPIGSRRFAHSYLERKEGQYSDPALPVPALLTDHNRPAIVAYTVEADCQRAVGVGVFVEEKTVKELKRVTCSFVPRLHITEDPPLPRYCWPPTGMSCFPARSHDNNGVRFSRLGK